MRPAGLPAPARAVGAALLALALAACGGEPAPEPSSPAPGGWRSLTLEGVKGASAVAALGDLLVVAAGGDDRSLSLLTPAALEDGARVRPRRLPLEVLRDMPLEGVGARRSDELVAQGYRLGTFWDQPLDFQGLALKRLPGSARVPALDVFYLLERSYGLVYHGSFVRGPDGAVAAARVTGAFVVPERPRAGRGRSDWRDSSAGLCGLLSVAREESAEDLYVLPCQGEPSGELRVDRLDRFGQWQGRFTLVLPGEGPADVADLSWADGRFVLLRGGGRGALHSVADPGDLGRARAGPPVPGPDVPGAGPWRGLAHLPDGSAFLVSAGDPSRLAWRRP